MSRVIEAAVVSDRGLARGNNEDNFCFRGRYLPLSSISRGGRMEYRGDDEIQLYAVCDGMGGEEAGEEASTEAARIIGGIEFDPYPQRERLKQALEAANLRVCEIRALHGAMVGCTMAALLITGNEAYALNIGDSRVYLVRDGVLKQISVDHTHERQMILMGIDPYARGVPPSRRKALSRYIGVLPEEASVQPHIDGPISLKPADKWLLCSDGLTDMVNGERICRVMNSAGSAADICNELKRLALAEGGADNVTALTVKIASIEKSDKMLSRILRIVCGR